MHVRACASRAVYTETRESEVTRKEGRKEKARRSKKKKKKKRKVREIVRVRMIAVVEVVVDRRARGGNV